MADMVAKMKMEFRKLGEERPVQEMSLGQLLYHALVVLTERDEDNMAVGQGA